MQDSPPPPPTNDPLDALTPAQRHALSAALTEAMVAEVEELANEGRAILAERAAAEDG